MAGAGLTSNFSLRIQMVEVALADELGDLALVDVAKVHAVLWSLVEILVGSHSPVGRHHRAANVYCLQLHGQKLIDAAVLRDVGDDEVHVAEAGHTDFTGDPGIGGGSPGQQWPTTSVRKSTE